MEIDFFSTKWEERERLYSQSVLVFVLALGLFLWGSLIVFADPSIKIPLKEDSKVPLSNRIFESAGEWRAPQESQEIWRAPEPHEFTLKNDRIKKKPSTLYNPTEGRDNWDPYMFPDNEDVHTKPAKIFEFRF